MITGEPVKSPIRSALDYVSDHAKTAGFIASIGLAIPFSPRFGPMGSAMATWFWLFVAFLFAAALIADFSEKYRLHIVLRILMTLVVLVLLLAFGWWLTQQADVEPHLLFSITPGRTVILDNSKGKSDISDVHIQAVEYLMGPPEEAVKIVRRRSVAGDLEDAPFTVKAGKTHDVNLNGFGILEIKDFDPNNLHSFMEAWTHFYCLRFAFVNTGTNARYVHYMIVSPYRGGPDIPEHPERVASSSAKPGSDVFPFNMLQAIKADCRSMWGTELMEYQP